VSIDIANESGVGVDEVALAAIARCVLDEMRIHPLAELSVLVVDEKAMAELHERWMGEPGPTDVLAFPMDELRPPHLGGVNAGRAGAEEPGPDPGLLGDVVLCPQVAAAQARDTGHSTQDELEMLAVHGLLHLLGYDHAEPDERAEMFGLQDRLLSSWRASRAAPAASGGAEGTPAANPPAENAEAEDAPAADPPAEDTQADSSPADDAPAGDPPAENAEAEDAPADSLGRQEGSGLCRPRAG
jgi:probable rRNA maturation factor